MKFSRAQIGQLTVSFFIVLAAWIGTGWNLWNGDREVYEKYYLERIDIADWGLEVGYGWLNILFQNFDISYQAFYCVLMLGVLLLVRRYFLRLSRPSICLIIYTILFLPLDYVLIRNTIAFAIWIQGVQLLLNDDIISRIKYFVITVLAALFHQSFLIFLFFSFLRVEKIWSIRVASSALIAWIACYFAIRTLTPLPEQVVLHLEYYNSSLISTLFTMIAHLCSAGLAIYAIHRSGTGAKDSKQRIKIFMINFNYASLALMVLYAESEIFVRLFRVMIFINYFYFVGCFKKSGFENRYSAAYLIIFAIFLFGAFIIPVWGETVAPLFHENSFFSF